MWKRIAAIVILLFSLSITGCVSTGAGLQSYVDSTDGYQFLYPNGWVPVEAKDGPDVVFRDLIEYSENLSVVISSVGEGKTLTDLGTPTDVGYRLSKNALSPPDSGRQAELLNAEELRKEDKIYYLLEYAVTLSNQQPRHDFASLAISHGKLYSFNLSSTERRWQKEKSIFEQVVKSFRVY
ncbi:MAG: photosystem II reaction center PsbP [Hormoscilla sp.]